MQMPGSIAAADLLCDDRPSDAAFGHVVFGGNATILRPLKDPPGMPTEDVLTLLESRILGLSVDRLTTAASDSTIRKSSDALLPRCTFAQMPRSVKTALAVLTDRVHPTFPNWGERTPATEMPSPGTDHDSIHCTVYSPWSWNR